MDEFKKRIALAVLYADGTKLPKLDDNVFNDFLAATLCEAKDQNVDSDVLLMMIDVCGYARELVFEQTSRLCDNIWESLCWVPVEMRVELHDLILAYETP